LSLGRVTPISRGAAPFIEKNFSIAGAARLHRKAVGWDLVKAPAKVVLAVPQIGLKLGAFVARKLGAAMAADRQLLIETAVAAGLRGRPITDLLHLPFAEGARVSKEDALAQAILAHPRVQANLAEENVAERASEPGFRARLEAALPDTPGGSPEGKARDRRALRDAAGNHRPKRDCARRRLLKRNGAGAEGDQASGDLGGGRAGAGVFSHGPFPIQASPFLVAGAKAGVVGVAAVATAFAGIVSDPVQRALGLHQRRLARFVDGLEDTFYSRGAGGFRAYDLFVARLMDLIDLLFGVTRTFRAG
jgi:hypothetical protein